MTECYSGVNECERVFLCVCDVLCFPLNIEENITFFLYKKSKNTRDKN